MALDILQALDQEIDKLKERLSSLEAAHRALSGGGTVRRQGKRRQFTAAQRAEISRRMKAAWAKRRKQSA